MYALLGKSFTWLAFAALAWTAVVFISPSSVAAQDSPQNMTIGLNEYEGSGVSGWATLTAQDDGVHVQMAVEGDQISGDHPTHIHTGTCNDFDPNPTFPLTTVILDPLSADGVSESDVPDVTLDALLADDHVILIHKSMAELTTYFVCGDINEDNVVEAPTSGSAGGVSLSGTGSGSSLGGGSKNVGIALASGFAGIVLAGIAFRIGRRSPGDLTARAVR
jgi:hypothetical protein